MILDIGYPYAYPILTWYSCIDKLTQIELIKALQAMDALGMYVIRRQNLRTAFAHESEKTFSEGLARMVGAGLLVSAARGVYVHEAAKSRDSWTIEHVAIALRPADLSYVSLESALSEYGVISQIPVGRITVMTTGRSGEFMTPYGTIEFTHTDRAPAGLRKAINRVDGRPLRVAKVETALRDLRRVGRNLHLVDMAEFEEVLAESMDGGQVGGDQPRGAPSTYPFDRPRP
ncbi:type IV toxin-antitoxin system AbiEi family antitoxin [Castellaniella caeni]|uniref:type IV toxin-antitoxin system AbiEi family antitoxin n=1 Tax=Castellaniella caeni TaxID=266123 RepID=UPI000A999F63|nr:hypothetical protein [Castellaniella caeni]